MELVICLLSISKGYDAVPWREVSRRDFQMTRACRILASITCWNQQLQHAIALARFQSDSKATYKYASSLDECRAITRAYP